MGYSELNYFSSWVILDNFGELFVGFDYGLLVSNFEVSHEGLIIKKMSSHIFEFKVVFFDGKECFGLLFIVDFELEAVFVLLYEEDDVFLI